MAKKSAKTLGIKKMMAGGAGTTPQSPQKHDRPAKEPSAGQQGESGDVLDDNFMAEEVAHGEGPDALDGGSSGEDLDGEDAKRAAASKKRKHEALKERKKALKAPRREDSAAISSAGAEGKAAFFLKHFRASDTGGKMSAVETSDYVSSEHFLGTSLALDSVGAQLAELCPACAGGTIGESPGEGAAAAPFVAVLVGSSERGRQVYDSLKEISKGNTVVKAFESHSKVKKLLSKFLASSACIGTRIVVATAGRLLRLLSGGEIDCERLQYVVLDLAADAKQRTLLDMREVREDVMKLHTQLFSPLLNSGQLKIAFL